MPGSNPPNNDELMYSPPPPHWGKRLLRNGGVLVAYVPILGACLTLIFVSCSRFHPG